MKIYAVILSLCISALGGFALAEHEEGHMGENFAENKTKMLTHIDDKIKAFQDHKTCVSAAADKDAMKACHEKMKAVRANWKEDWQENKADRKARREERKKK